MTNYIGNNSNRNDRGNNAIFELKDTQKQGLYEQIPKVLSFEVIPMLNEHQSIKPKVRLINEHEQQQTLSIKHKLIVNELFKTFEIIKVSNDLKSLGFIEVFKWLVLKI